MALTDDELIAISALPVGKNDNATLQPDLIAPYEVRDTTDSVFALPYQNTNIDVFGGGAAGSWSLNFQNPLQRVVLDLEVFFGDRSAENAPPNLSALTMTLTGFSSGVIFAPATAFDAAAPANYFGLTVSGLAPVTDLSTLDRIKVSFLSRVWDCCRDQVRQPTLSAFTFLSELMNGVVL